MSCGIGLVGGPLYQWDSDRRVRVAAPGATQAHFAPLGSARALVTEVGQDGEADVPNQVLQQPRDVAVWASDGDRTLARAVLPVRPRAKPDGYIYTPTEVQTWEDVEGWVRGQLAHAGEPGTKWYVGDGAPSIGGRVGDLYLDAETGRYYRYGEAKESK